MRKRLRQDLHTLAGAYALDALPDEELPRFEEHLAHCESCVQEVRSLRETAAVLGEAAVRTPPEGMRRRVLDEASRTRQLAPAPLPYAAPQPRWWRGRSGLVLAACLAVMLVLASVVTAQYWHITELRKNEEQIASVLASADAETTTVHPSEGVTATLISSESQDRAVFSGHGLDQLDERDYQLWLADPDESVRSAGLLDVEPEGRVRPLIASHLGEAEAVAVTVEPEGGSRQPTTEPVMSVPLEG